MYYLLALFMFCPALASRDVVQTPTAKSQDFLFLAEEEPEAEQPGAPVPDTKDEEVISCPVPACDPKLPEWKNKPQAGYDQHRKTEDLTSELLPPNFCIRKKLGCFNISGKFLPDGYWARNVSFLNKCFPEDSAFFVRHTFDLNVEAVSDTVRYGERTAELKLTIRNKGNWGVPGSVAPTTESSVSTAGVTFGSHSHGLSRHVLWIREVWLNVLLNAVLRTDENLPKHYFKLGFFPFQLGHGIALGAFYGVTPGLVGFYSDNAVDQWAPGFLFTGEFIPERIKYDLYGAILQNFADSVKSNMEPIYAQRYGFQKTPERGFGHVNWLIAARMEFVPLKDPKWGTLEVEPYIFYNQIPELKIEFPADAEAKLTTAGFDIDYAVGPFEMSYEFAHNFGRERVFGWDNNLPCFQNQNGTAVVANTKVTDTSTSKSALVTDANQALINAVPQSESQNGQFIGTSGGITGLKNASDRFTDPYTTLFRGWMMIGEAAYWFFDKQLGVAFGGGIATGDDNPNVNATSVRAPLPDGKYQGFVGIQEGYTGELVESAFFLGLGKTVRPLSLPENGIEHAIPSSKTSGFTNLVYFGTGLHCKPKVKSKIVARPNIIAFFQQDASRKFDAVHGKQLNTPASNFYGLELNIFFDIFPLEFLKNTLVAGLFLPGGHYSDIKGIPLDATQAKLFNTGADPLLSRSVGDDKAFFFNLRMEYRF